MQLRANHDASWCELSVSPLQAVDTRDSNAASLCKIPWHGVMVSPSLFFLFWCLI